MDTLFRRGTRAGADASGDGKYARQGGGADQANPARSASPRQARATAMADDRGWATDRGHFSLAPGTDLRPRDPSRAPQAVGGLAEKLPPAGTLRQPRSAEGRAGRARSAGRAPYGRESSRQRRHIAKRSAYARLSRVRGRGAVARGRRDRRHARAWRFPAR